jgi:peptidoglycan/LPS O-acetylase OafA/YrhL
MPGNRRIDVLDGWRAVSVALVIAGHLLNYSSLAMVSIFGRYSILGVQIFFVISGFVICRGFIAERAAFGSISLTAFYVRRIFRILPPLLFYVAAIVALVQLGLVDRMSIGVVRSLIFVCNLPAMDCGGWLGSHTWSLSTEEQFYLAFPLIVPLFLEQGVRARVVMAAIAVGLPALCLLLYAAKFGGGAQFLSQFVPIGAGVVWALNEEAVARLAARMAWPGFFAALILLFTVSYFSGSALAAVLNLLFDAPLIVAVLAGSIGGVPGVSAVLKSPPLRTIGLVSYSVYLWQQLATTAVPGAGPAYYAITLSLCLGWALVSFYGVEKRLIRAGHLASSRLKGKGVAVTFNLASPLSPPPP